MQDYIAMQKLWYDVHLAQIEVVGSSEFITASAKIYVCDDLIDGLIRQIERFVNGEVSEAYWANEQKGDGSTTCVALRFMHKDRLGHVLIEVFMELDDGGSYATHNCCFYVNTEIGQLERFCGKIPILKQDTVGVRIVLNDND
ncbi:MAG: hypothetical protein Q4C93_02720 [Clostridia bacterium]|nr:hypothetical protein [Clostridia bacterium]